MSQKKLVPFQELDFCLPVQRFRIEYSLIERNDLSFVREFVLRLLYISAQGVEEIAKFFGFTGKEVKVALADLLDKGDIGYLPDGRVHLTAKSRAYFESGSEERPQINKIVDDRRSFHFDLLSFNYVSSDVRSSDGRMSFRLQADSESRTNSEERARKAFQDRFYEIYDSGDIKPVDSGKSERPDIYKISDVYKQREAVFRFSHTFYIDPETSATERSELNYLKDQERIIAEVTSVLDQARQGDNIRSIAAAADRYADTLALSALSVDGLNIADLLIEQAIAKDKVEDRQFFFGSLTLQRNWDKVNHLLKMHKERIKSAGKDSLPELLWLAPSNNFWGKTERIKACLSDIVSSEKYSKKDGERILEAKILLPLDGKDDHKGKRFWLTEFSQYRNYLHGFVPSLYGGDVEIICLSDCFAVITYHLFQPGRFQLPVPFGFMTENKRLVQQIEQDVASSLSEYTSDLTKRYLGKLEEKQARNR